MNRETIRAKLNRYDELQATLTRLQMDQAKALGEVVPPKVQAAMDRVRDKYGFRLSETQKDIDALGQAIKAAVLELGESVEGRALAAVYSPGRTIWDVERLERYAETHAHVAKLKKVTKGSVTIGPRA